MREPFFSTVPAEIGDRSGQNLPFSLKIPGKCRERRETA